MINDGGPAFPEAGLSGLPNDQFVYGRSGMTLRDYFAAKALSGWCSHFGIAGSNVPSDTDIVRYAYEMADAMIKQRGEE